MNTIRVVAVALILCTETIESAPRKPRLTIMAEPMPTYYHVNVGGVSGTYSFAYDVWDPVTRNTQFRSEERYPNGTVAGIYGYHDALGEPRIYKYVADEKGYRVRNINRNEPLNSPPIKVAASTESSVTWTRPSKKKPQYNKENLYQRRKYNDVQPQGHYQFY